MGSAIEIKELSKWYGKVQALDNLSLSIDHGEIVGFVGPNGAGKTTTMRILTSLLAPTSGDILVDGHSVREEPREVRRRVGYMPDFFGVYDDMKVWEYLDFYAACYDVPINSRISMIGDLLALVELTHKRDEYVMSLSRGMKQRLSLARTLAHDPQVLALDEPASGMDPRARVEIRELLRELNRMGKTIFVSSHILSELADICTRIAIIEAGKLVILGTMKELQGSMGAQKTVTISSLGSAEELTRALNTFKGVLSVRDIQGNGPGRRTVEAEFAGDEHDVSGLLSSLVEKGIPVVGFSEKSSTLEDLFMTLTEGKVT